MALAGALAARDSGDSASDQRVLLASEIVDAMEFRMGGTDLEKNRSRVLTRRYWEDSLAPDRIQLLLNVKAIVISRSSNGRCEITHDSLPAGVGFFDPDQFFAAKLYGAHYELTGDASGRKSFRYVDIAAPTRERLEAAGFYSAIADISRSIQRPKHANPEAEPAGRRITRKSASSQMASSRAKAKDNDPPTHADRKKCSLIPGSHSVAEMANPREHCGAIRRAVAVTRQTICRNAGMAHLHDIQDPPAPSFRSLMAPAITHPISTIALAVPIRFSLSFASIGSYVDALILQGEVTFIAYAGPCAADLDRWSQMEEMPRDMRRYTFSIQAMIRNLEIHWRRTRRGAPSSLIYTQCWVNIIPPIPFTDCAAAEGGAREIAADSSRGRRRERERERARENAV